MKSRDHKYLKIILDRLNTCKEYHPKFGTGSAATLQDFKLMYGKDPFYSWFGLDNPALYAAHKAAGGITSLYRQIGLGSEELFRQVLQDEFDLSSEQVEWSYEVTTPDGRTRTLSSDGRIAYEHISNPEKRQRIRDWVKNFSSKLGNEKKI